MNLVEFFCHVDDFCQGFEPAWIRAQFTTGRRQRVCRSPLFERDRDLVGLVSHVPVSHVYELTLI